MTGIRLVSPFPAWAFPQVFAWLQPVARRVFDDYVPRELGGFVEFLEAYTSRSMTWGVYRDDELGGLIVAEPHGDRLRRIQVFFKKSFWGRANTVPAVTQALDGIFLDAKVVKVCTFPFADNHSMRPFLHSLGFVLEGTLRKQALRDGQGIDLLAFGLLREEHSATRRISNSRGHIRHRGVSWGVRREETDLDQHVTADVHAGTDPTAKHGVRPAHEAVEHPI